MTEAPEAFARAEQRHWAATPTSRTFYEEAKGLLPGGIGRAGIPFTHYPLFIESVLHALDKEAYRYLSHIGDYCRAGVRALIKEMNVAVQVTRTHHFSALHYTDHPVRTAADVRRGNVATARRVGFSLLSQGFMMYAGRSKLSTAVAEGDIARFVEALGVAFEDAGLLADMAA